MAWQDVVAEFAFRLVPDGGGDPLPLTAAWKFPVVSVSESDTAGSNDLTVLNPHDVGGELQVYDPVTGEGVTWPDAPMVWPDRIEAGESHTRTYSFDLDPSAFPAGSAGGDRVSVVRVTVGGPDA